MVELFGSSKANINEHITNIYQQGELTQDFWRSNKESAKLTKNHKKVLKIMKFKHIFLSILFSVLCLSQAFAAEIPAKFLGKWVTIMTDDVAHGGRWYMYAKEDGGQKYLGQTQAAPNESNYAAYCWLIEGNATDGYTFRNLKYDNDTKQYIANPASASFSYADKVILAPAADAGHYLYTANRQLEVKDHSGKYLALFSRSYGEFRYHTSDNYEGSRLTFSAINDWTVQAVVINADQTTTPLSEGGIMVGSNDYKNGTTFTGGVNPTYTQRPVTGYTAIGFEVDEEANIITSKYASNSTGAIVTPAPAPADGQNAITGNNSKIWLLNPAHYITNTSGNYSAGVPAGKAWQMEIVIERPSTQESFNQWGSTIISSTSDPFNAQYYNNFQIYQQKAGKINFKSSVASGGDNFIAQNNTVLQNYKIIVRCDGANVYVIRTIRLNNDFTETSTFYDNLYVSARNQGAITQMSCALPSGINIKSLRITIAEESDLIAGQSYAIYNKGTKQYLSWDYTAGAANFAQMDGYVGVSHASECQIEFETDKVTYNDALYTPFYLKTDVWAVASGQSQSSGHIETLYVGADNKVVADASDKKKFIFASNKIIPVDESGTPGTAWSLGSSEDWEFDMFASYDVEVIAPSVPDVSNFGGMMYKTTQIKHGEQVKYPASAPAESFPYWEEAGYACSVTKDATKLIVNYIFNNDYFDNRLIDFNQNTEGDNPDNKYYGTIYAPVPLQMPAGVKAYIVTGTTTQGGTTMLTLSEIADGSSTTDNVLHSQCAAVLVKDDTPDATTVFTVAASEPSPAPTGNLLQGSAVLKERDTSKTTYVLSGSNGVGFYMYVGGVIPAFKAYYEVPTAPSAPAYRGFSFDDNTTAIEQVEAEEVSMQAPAIYYDLLGCKVAHPVRGRIYICNGRKVIF